MELKTVKRQAVVLWVLTGLLPSVAAADYLVVSRRVTLREQPTAGAEPVLQAEPGQVLMVSDGADRVNRFYPVEYPSGRTSWVYQSFVTRHEGEPPPATEDTALEPLQVFVINVGQGDAILIRCPDGQHEMLIDAGDTRYPGSAASFQQQLTALQAGSPAVTGTWEVAIGKPNRDCRRCRCGGCCATRCCLDCELIQTEPRKRSPIPRRIPTGRFMSRSEGGGSCSSCCRSAALPLRRSVWPGG